MITIAKQYCDDCFDNCWFATNQATGQVTHVDDLATFTTHLHRAGYYYAGHVAGEQRYKESYRLAAITPLALDWQMAHESISALEVDSN